MQIKKQTEREVFGAFLECRPDLKESVWDYGDDPPDFVLLEGCIGVELRQWLHEDQMQRSQELNRFKREIQEAASERGLSEFLRSFTTSTDPRYTVTLDVREIPTSKDKSTIINNLLNFLLQNTREPPARRGAIVIRDSELPQELGRFFRRIWIQIPSRSCGLGIGISIGGHFDSGVALNGLKKALAEKVAHPPYQTLKSGKCLGELWLVVYWDQGVAANTPYWGINVGSTDTSDEEEIVCQASSYLRGIGHGPFDKIFLFFKHKGLTFQLFPRQQ